MSTLTDTRTIENLAAAKMVHEKLAHCDCRIASENARTEKRIADEKSKSKARMAEDLALQASLERQLTAFILSHHDQFEKPRSVKTEFGEFGLRLVADRLCMADDEAVVQWAKANNHPELLREVKMTVVDRDAVKRMLKGGEEVPGCSLPQGERAFYKVAKAMIEAATTIVGE